MNALARFEGFMQELMDRRVVRLLGGSLQPVELAHAIARCLDGAPAAVAAPDRFQIMLNPDDAADLRALDPGLERKLARYAVELARERNLNFSASPRVLLVADADIPRGRADVRAEVTSSVPHRSESEWGRPAQGLQLEVPRPDGHSAGLPVDHFPFVIGRKEGCDLVLADARVSRRHAVIEHIAGRHLVRDLGSRNGTNVNGQPAAEAELRDGDRLAVGGFEMIVRVSAGA